MSFSLRVAMIIQAYHPHVGGAERQLMALVPLLQERGVDIHILTRRYPGLKPFEVIGGAPVHRLPIFGPKAIASLAFTLTALPLVARLRPHLLHAHELLSPTTTAVVAKSLFQIPVAAKVLSSGQNGDLYKVQHKPFGQRRLAAFRQKVDAFIAISQEIDAELATAGILAEKRHLIPNGVDIKRFKPVNSQTKQSLRTLLGLPEGLIALFMGRLVRQKRVDQLISIWPDVRDVHPNATLLLLGTGEEENQLRQKAGAGVHFAGRIENVLPYLQTADLFILPSAQEGLSNALLEAMAVGLPTIATNVGGAPDVIKHNHNGWLTPPDDPTLLRQGVLSMLSDAERRTQFGTLGRERILRDYALSITADRLVNLYHHLLNPQLQMGEVS